VIDTLEEIILTSYSAADKKISYKELEKENKRLKLALSRASNPPESIGYEMNQSSSSSVNDEDRDEDIDLDRYENTLFLSCPQHSRPLHGGVPIIQLPSRESSKAIVRYGSLWTSWVHFALDNDKFEAEHEAFWAALAVGGNVEDQDPLWLAIYFSFITVGKFC
jgi:hypothetical protein